MDYIYTYIIRDYNTTPSKLKAVLNAAKKTKSLQENMNKSALIAEHSILPIDVTTLGLPPATFSHNQPQGGRILSYQPVSTHSRAKAGRTFSHIPL